MRTINVYQTAVATRFADAVLRLGAAYEEAARFAADTLTAIEGAERLEMDTAAMRVIHAEDCRRADAAYATLLILMADVPAAQVFAGIWGGWRVRVEWRPQIENHKLTVYAEQIE